MNVLPLDLVDLRKVRLHGLGVRVGGEDAGQPSWLSLRRDKEHYVRRRHGHSEDAATIEESKGILPSFQHKQAQNPGCSQALGPTGATDVRWAHRPQTALSSAIVTGWHRARPETHISPRGSRKAPWAALAPRRPWAAAASKPWPAKQPAPCARQALPPRVSLALSVRSAFQTPGMKEAHTWLQVKNPELSPSRTLNMLVTGPSVIWFGCVVLHFLHQTFDKV